MILPVVLVLAAVQQAQPQQPELPPSPVADVVVTPADAMLTPGDTVRLHAEARDATGRVLDNARYRFGVTGGYFEGRVDSTGLVTAGSTGTIRVSVVALVAGARSTVKRVDVRVLPGPVARVAVADHPATLVVGQRMRLAAKSFSKEGDERADKPTWRSSNTAILRVDGTGTVTAVAAGRASVTASVGAVSERVAVQVVPNTIASVEIRPGDVTARQGDVVRFTVRALDAAGREIRGLTPMWSFSPGQGMIDQDGRFVGYEAGGYLVTASFGRASAQVPVTLTFRDVRRAVQVVGRLPRTLFNTEEVWVHPSGRYVYLGTGSGGDRM